MRRFSNLVIWLAALAVCGLMTWLSLGAGFYTAVFNIGVLGVMLIIVLLGRIIGIGRLERVASRLDDAADLLEDNLRSGKGPGELTRSGTTLFGIEYLDRKYQEYLGYLRRSGSPTDIGDFIGETEISNYTQRKVTEMIPDILTSLGILGTFVGLVLGLRGFNPVSYEAMASSITSLVDGIKVAFVTSIYGLSLSIAFSYTFRGALNLASESLDNFTDKYYLCAVPPENGAAINRVISNQKAQLQATQEMGTILAEQLSGSVAQNLDPMLAEIDRTLQHFTDVVTLNQQELLENMASSVMAAMKKEFIAEFVEMRSMLKESNRQQRAYVDFLGNATAQFQEQLRTGNQEMTRIIKAHGTGTDAMLTQLKSQQKNLTEFTDYMARAMDSMVRMNEKNERLQDAVDRRIASMEEITQENLNLVREAQAAAIEARKAARDAELPVQRTEITDLDMLTDRMDRMIILLEKQQKQRKGLFK